MKPLFESHCHYHLYDLSPLSEAELLKEEFATTGVEKCCFLSIPLKYELDGKKIFDPIHNFRGLFLKKYFSPNGYAFAGLIHPQNYDDIDMVSNYFLKQVKTYRSMGFDGMKMLEGYPTFIKYTGQGIDSPIYDKFYDFCEKNNFPITMHIANPDENWDISKASKEAIDQGRVYSHDFPTKEEITSQMFNVLSKHPNLPLNLAHFGFFSHHYEDAIKFMSYKKTRLDITPGGEQFIYISNHWDLWKEFFIKYQDRIIYGSDFYPFIKNKDWTISFTRRPNFLRKWLETDSEHEYLGTKFRGVKLDDEILKKIYMTNYENILGNPKEIKISLTIKEIDKLEKMNIKEKDKKDLIFIKEFLLK